MVCKGPPAERSVGGGNGAAGLAVPEIEARVAGDDYAVGVQREAAEEEPRLPRAHGAEAAFGLVVPDVRVAELEVQGVVAVAVDHRAGAAVAHEGTGPPVRRHRVPHEVALRERGRVIHFVQRGVLGLGRGGARDHREGEEPGARSSDHRCSV